MYSYVGHKKLLYALKYVVLQGFLYPGVEVTES